MVFNSYGFVLAFMPVFMLGLNIVRSLGRKRGCERLFCNAWIIFVSLYFFSTFGAKNLAILFISVIWNVCTSIPMSFMRDQNVKIRFLGKERMPHRIWLFMGVCGNLVLLLFFKLSGIFLPLAISFYTFNQISYIVDLYRGDVEHFDALDYLTYVLFFPKLLQGPIMGFGSFTKELSKVHQSDFDWEKIMRGLLLFSMGLFKKVILADTFGKAVDFAYGSVAGLGSLEAILTAVFYSFQLYFDFSGYCDMAGALCMMMGFDLPVNFDSPYQAVNIIDFWKRWHITLTKFFTGYLYIPLGGNRKGAVRTYINLMIIFLVSGFWHGTGLTFIIWGAMHGVLYVITRMVQNREKGGTKGSEPVTAGSGNGGNDSRTLKAGSRLGRACKVILTFLYVTAAWVFFRAESVGQALALFGRMFIGGAKPIATGLSSCFRLDEFWYVLKVTPLMKYNFVWDICLWMFLLVSVIMIFFRKNALKTVKECHIGVLTTLITVFLFIWSIISFGGVSTFLYMNF